MNAKSFTIAGLLAGAMLVAGCETKSAGPAGVAAAPAATEQAQAAAPAEPSELKPLAPLKLKAALPAEAKVENVEQGKGMPKRVGITSFEPELIFDVEEVDQLSPRYEEIVKYGTATVMPGDKTNVKKNEKNKDGTFTVLIERTTASKELGDLKSYSVDKRVAVGGKKYDCTGSASSLEAAERVLKACGTLQAI